MGPMRSVSLGTVTVLGGTPNHETKVSHPRLQLIHGASKSTNHDGYFCHSIVKHHSQACSSDLFI